MSNELTIRKPAGAIALPDNDQWADRFEIRSESSNRKYIIARNKKTGQYGCSCPGYRIAKHGVRSCKHLTQGCNLQFNQIHGNGLPAPAAAKRKRLN